jgi:hypothetical protein
MESVYVSILAERYARDMLKLDGGMSDRWKMRLKVTKDVEWEIMKDSE